MTLQAGFAPGVSVRRGLAHAVTGPVDVRSPARAICGQDVKASLFEFDQRGRSCVDCMVLAALGGVSGANRAVRVVLAAALRGGGTLARTEAGNYQVTRRDRCRWLIVLNADGGLHVATRLDGTPERVSHLGQLRRHLTTTKGAP